MNSAGLIFKLIFVFFLSVLLSCEKEEDNSDPINGEEAENGGENNDELSLVGNWLLVSEDVFDGPAEKPCNAIFFEAQKNDYLIFSFLNSDPVAGHRGSYDFEIEDSLEIDLIYQYNEDEYSWSLLEEPFNMVIATIMHPNGNSFNLYPEEDLTLTFINCMKDIPVHLTGTWSYKIDETLYATMQIDNGEFIWDDTQESKQQSGNIFTLGEVNDNYYLLSHITYCDYETEGESDYYTLNKYSYESDVLTLWHGETVMTLERSN